MIRSFIVTVCLVPCLCAIANTSTLAFASDDSSPAILAAVKRAKSLACSGQSDLAIISLNDAIRQHDSAGDLYFHRAMFLQKTDRDARAISDFTRAIELNCMPALAYASRAVSKLSMGERKGAIADFNVAIEQDPELAIAYLGRGRIHFEDENISLALRDLDKVVQLDPDVDAYTARAMCHIEMGDHAAACSDLTNAVKLDPASAVSSICVRASIWNAAMKRPRLQIIKGRKSSTIIQYDSQSTGEPFRAPEPDLRHWIRWTIKLPGPVTVVVIRLKNHAYS